MQRLIVAAKKARRGVPLALQIKHPGGDLPARVQVYIRQNGHAPNMLTPVIPMDDDEAENIQPTQIMTTLGAEIFDGQSVVFEFSPAFDGEVILSQNLTILDAKSIITRNLSDGFINKVRKICNRLWCIRDAGQIRISSGFYQGAKQSG